MKKDRVYIFLHIPKTAGSTLHRIIERNVEPHECFTTASPFASAVERFGSLPEWRRNLLRIVKGHMYFGVHNHLQREARYFTVIRDPVSRVISEYNYILTRKGSGDYIALRGGEFGLGEALEGRVLWDNLQCRYLLGPEGFARRGPEGISELDYQLIERRLERYFDGVYLMTDFDKMIVDLKAKLDLTEVRYILRNKGKPASEVNGELQSAILKENFWDNKLYRSIVALKEHREKSEVLRVRQEDPGYRTIQWKSFAAFLRHRTYWRAIEISGRLSRQLLK